MSRTVNAQYRQSLFAVPDPRLRRSLAIATGLGLVLLAVAVFAPVRVAAPPRVEEVPERLAKLILEKRKPPPVLSPAPHIETPELVAPPEPVTPEPAPEAKAETRPEPKVEPKAVAPPRRAREETKLAEDRGTAGRAKAKTEVAQALESTTQSVQSTLRDLQSDLAGISASAGASNAPLRRGGRGRPGRGRSSNEVASAVTAREAVGEGGGGGQVVTGALIDIESIGNGSGDVASADPSVSGGGASGSYRSNASLLAVVRKYAAGIQFCYDNQLKREPGLEGKMVVVLTVLASGRVSEATIADDSLGSGALRECVLLQVREWKFPSIPEGTVTFRTPFVFTPPN